MKLVIPEQMAAIDLYAITKLGIPGIVLMENAALKVAEEAEKMLKSIKGRRILLVAGKGNNGGDAFAAARHLFNKGADVAIYIAAKASDISGDAAINLNILQMMKIKTVELTEKGQIATFYNEVDRAELIIDGIFGTGFKGTINGLIKDIVEYVNSSSKAILSIDIPSGVNGETGEADICIKAVKTVTFGLLKRGLVIHPGCEYTGEIVLADIGIPKEAVENQNIKFEVIDRDMIAAGLPRRVTNSNKGDYGRVLIISGSTGMTGSGCLCANAALRSGAGLVYLGVPASLAPIYSAALLEPIVLPLDDNGKGVFSNAGAEEIIEKLEKISAVAVGPGISTGEGAAKTVYSIIENTKVPLILDADALNIISNDINILLKLKTQAVITPHPGEMARLTGLKISEIQANRCKVAEDFAREWGIIVVLKGARTVIAIPDGRVYICIDGNPGMSTAGTGDVLTGIIAGLAAQGIALESAAIAGVYLHAKAGDLTAMHKGMAGMVAGDILEKIPYMLKNF